MKKRPYIIVVLILLITLYWCSLETSKNLNTENQKQQTNQKNNNIENIVISEKENPDNIYENKVFWFRLTIPKWRSFEEKNKIEKNMWMLVSFFPSEKEEIDNKQNLSISMANEKSIEEFYSQQKETIKDYINNFEELSNENIVINKINWIKNIFKWERWWEYLQRQQILLNKNWITFIITYTSKEDFFDQNLDQINSIINSLNF